MTMHVATHRIFILEDDRDIAAIFARALKAEGYETEQFGDVHSFVQRVRERSPALCIVDLGLPDGSGLSVLRNLLSDLGVATIIVTGRGGLDDKLKGLQSGADDYIVKPVEPLELVARVKTVLRRVSRRMEIAQWAMPEQGNSDLAEFAGWRVDFGSYRLTSPDNEITTLSKGDTQILRAFLEAQGRVLSREFLLKLCVAAGDENYDRTIDVRVSRLRKKLRDDSRQPTHIRTVYGAGYVFASTATWL
jgi:DNA-binding response OmpR family regulator